MKEIRTEEHIPEIKDILETKLDETGVRLYKIAWKTSWLSEGCLQRYKDQIDEFWKREEGQIMDNNNTLKETNCSEVNDEENEDSGRMEKESVTESEDDDSEISVSNVQSSKRKCTWNLEDIVLKLKRSKNSRSDIDIPPVSPETSVTNEIKDDDYALSPVFPRDMNDDHKQYLMQRSSFLTQLEQKDNMSLMETLEQEASTNLPEEPCSSNEESNDSEDGWVDRNVKETKRKSEELQSGDFQLAKLLEEEKMLGSEGNDKIEETKCNKCNKRFYRRSQLIRHLSNHVVHECLQCNAVFYCVKKYKKHMSMHETYPCDFCSEEFYDASAWYQHRAKHTMMECSCCDMVFYNKTALAKHKFEHSEYICPLCRFTCENLHHWISHRNYHGRCSLLQPIIACRECKSTFGSQEVFLKHKCAQLTAGNNKRSPISSAAKPLQEPPLPKPIYKPRMQPLVPPKNLVKPRRDSDLLPYKKHSSFANKSKIARPEPVYFTEQSKSKLFMYPYHQQKGFKGVMNKKDIKDMIGVDQTLTCSS